VSAVLKISDVAIDSLQTLLERFQLSLEVQPGDEDVTGSFWGESEAGIVATSVYVRNDTPVHSLLHETCHVICMTQDRRETLDKDAGGSDLEEAAVCYLQILLADHIDTVGRERLMQDMDSWGYSFRLGATSRWFEEDADDARAWLLDQGLIDESDAVRFRLRH
jgi:hypothetical protein